MDGQSGLALISCYNDSSDSDTDNDEEEKKPLHLKNDQSFGEYLDRESTNHVHLSSCNRIPLPPSITEMFQDNQILKSTPKDDPRLHEGRIRSFPHERGNWSTYVYVPYTAGEGFEVLVESLRICAEKAAIDLKPVSDPHISLTRTIVLLHHWIESFVLTVRAKLSPFPRFQVVLGPPAVYCNEERTRTFLGLKVLAGSDSLCDMAHTLDDCLAEFRLPPFYKDPQFHMSVLWTLGDARLTLEALIPQFHKEFSNHALEQPDSFHLDVLECNCKTGNKLFTFPLMKL